MHVAEGIAGIHGEKHKECICNHFSDCIYIPKQGG